MAELRDRIDITVEELEESLGAVRLPRFIAESEKSFVGRIDSICDEICSDTNKRAIFVSGPTSSGKTTFTLRLSNTINKRGRKAVHLSLDDYYNIKDVKCDKEGRPDFETIDALDVERIQRDIKALLDGETVVPPFFDFNIRKQMEGDPANAICLGDDGVLVVEGLHGLSPRISGECPAEKCSKVFIMPYGNVYCDSKLMDSNEIRLLSFIRLYEYLQRRSYPEMGIQGNRQEARFHTELRMVRCKVDRPATGCRMACKYPPEHESQRYSQEPAGIKRSYHCRS